MIPFPLLAEKFFGELLNFDTVTKHDLYTFFQSFKCETMISVFDDSIGNMMKNRTWVWQFPGSSGSIGHKLVN